MEHISYIINGVGLNVAIMGKEPLCDEWMNEYPAVGRIFTRCYYMNILWIGRVHCLELGGTFPPIWVVWGFELRNCHKKGQREALCDESLVFTHAMEKWILSNESYVLCQGRDAPQNAKKRRILPTNGQQLPSKKPPLHVTRLDTKKIVCCRPGNGQQST